MKLNKINNRTINTSAGKEVFANSILAFILPFAVFYWMIPFLSQYTIGNDYLNYWVNMQLFLRFSIKNGTFPLYAPGFNTGWTASALSLGQLWHPISWIASIIPGYWQGHAHQIGTMLRLVSLGFTHLALLSVLRKIQVKWVWAFLFSFVAVYNLRMLDMFRYGASLENYTGFLLLIAAVIWHFVSDRKYLPPLCIIGSSWLVMVGGHPQMIYYSFTGIAVVCAIMPFYIKSLKGMEQRITYKPIRRYYSTTMVCTLAGIMLAACYFLPFYFEYMQDSWRGEETLFSWSCSNQDVPIGAICNFFSPFYSDVHGAFGGSALFIIAAIVPVAYLFKFRLQWPIMALWFFCLIIVLLSLGSRGGLYYYFWKYFPLANSFRVPGRTAFVLPALFMLILAGMSRLKPETITIKQQCYSINVISILSVAAILLFVVFRVFVHIDVAFLSPYTPLKLNNPSSCVIVLFFALSTAILTGLIFIPTGHNRLRFFISIAVVFATLFQTASVLRYGTWIAKAPRITPTFEQLSGLQKAGPIYPAETGDWSRKAIEEHAQKTFFEPLIARICTDYTFVSNTEEFYQKVSQYSCPGHIYIEKKLQQPDIPNKPPSVKNRNSITLKDNSFNRFCFEADTSAAGFFVFSPPSERWQANVDGEKKSVYRANGIETAVWLEAGKHKVEYYYRSVASVVGMIISLLVLFAISTVILKDIKHLYLRIACITVSFIFCSLMFMFWYWTLYAGKNIGMAFCRTDGFKTERQYGKNNLAYGKITNMSLEGIRKSYSNLSSCGVDGSYYPRFGFISGYQKNSWWQVDLGKIRSVDNIRLFRFKVNSVDYCSLPFSIKVSENGDGWKKIITINNYLGEYWDVKLQKSIDAKYIRLETEGTGRLAFSEVEIYGADD